MVAVAFLQAADNGYLGERVVSLLGAERRLASLIVIGVLALLVLAATWIWEGKQTAKAEAAQVIAPDVIDPYAGGYPVPPLPGQRLQEAQSAAPKEVIHG